MHKITSINNLTREVTITHVSGASHTFVIPDNVDKKEYVKQKMEQHLTDLGVSESITQVDQATAEVPSSNIIKKLWDKIWAI